MKSFLLFFFLINFSAFAQKKKPVYYLDEADYQITEKIFLAKYQNQKDSVSYHSITLEADTCYFQKLVLTKNVGRINLKDYTAINKLLVISEKSPKHKFTIIRYHPGKDKCNSGKAIGRGFNQRKIRKNEKLFNAKNFWVHKKDNAVDYIDTKNVNWILDFDRRIERIFFKYHYPCGSVVIIDNNTRNYTSLLGEYSLISVAKVMSKMSKLP